MAAMADPAHPQLRRRYGNFFNGLSAVKVDPKGPVNRENIEAEKTEHRPRAHQQKRNSGGEADNAEKHNQNEKTATVQRSMRCELRRKQRRLYHVNIVACRHRV